MSTQTLAQRRAAHALGRIRKLEAADAKNYGNYVSYVEALPATILMNGLGQAAATLLSKAGDAKKDPFEPHRLLYFDLQDWLCGSDAAAPYPKATGGDDRLLRAIIDKDQRSYLRAQAEALAYLVWLKKFANAYLKRE